MRRLFVFFASALILLGLARPARAQSAVEVTDVQVNYTFGEEITFKARLHSQSAIREASLQVLVEGEEQVRSFPLTVASDGSAQYRYMLQPDTIRPYARVTFWFECSLATGGKVNSARYFFKYDDNRYTWQTLQDEDLRVHWYSGEAAFGQAALEAARTGLQTIRGLIPVAAGEPIDVYIYASAADVQQALGLNGLTWVSGHASPDLGVVLVSIAPGEGQAAELQRQIPHELAHVLLFRQAGAAYNSLPAWLREGLASLAEQTPNEGNSQMLKTASRNKALLPISDLCGLFPQDASGAGLAYAELASFTRYLHATYGTSGLQTLIRAYADGLDCTSGASRAYGLSLSQLDLRWQQSVLGKNETGIALENMLPYLAILIAILVAPTWYIVLTLRSRREAHGKHESD